MLPQDTRCRSFASVIIGRLFLPNLGKGKAVLMATFEQVRQIVGDVLQLGDRTNSLQPETALLGNIPEFDSMAVVGVITALEEQLGIVVEDDDITGETFETLGNLTEFVNSKL